MKHKCTFFLTTILLLTGCNHNSNQHSAGNKTNNHDTAVQNSGEKTTYEWKYVNKPYVSLDESIVTRTATPTLKLLEYALEPIKDATLSPASYLLCATGLGAVSSNVNTSVLGVHDVTLDLDKLLTNWNMEYELSSAEYGTTAKGFFRSEILHQQVGPTYAFDENKRKEVEKDHISTMVSSRASWNTDASNFFHDKMEMNLQVPNVDIVKDATITYGALKMKDCVPDSLPHGNRSFTNAGETRNVDSYVFGSETLPTDLSFYENDYYQVFTIKINLTDMMVILPKGSVSLNDFSIAEAYSNFMFMKETKPCYGYVPFFHNKTDYLDLSDTSKELVLPNTKFMTRLLKDDVQNDLTLSNILQTSDFEFTKDGVCGESITMMLMEGASQPQIKEGIKLEVNRPFYAISLKDDFPMFVNKVYNPGT